MVDISDKSIAEAWAAVKDNHSETNYAVFKYAGTSRVVTTEKTGKTGIYNLLSGGLAEDEVAFVGFRFMRQETEDETCLLTWIGGKAPQDAKAAAADGKALAALLKPVAGPQGGAPCTIRATRPGQIEPMAVQAKLSKLTRTAHVELPGDPKHKSVMIGGTALQVTGGDETKVMTKKTVIEAQAATKSSTTHTSIEEGDVLGCLTVVEVGEEAKWLKEFPAGDKTITGAAKPLVANVQLGVDIKEYYAQLDSAEHAENGLARGEKQGTLKVWKLAQLKQIKSKTEIFTAKVDGAAFIEIDRKSTGVINFRQFIRWWKKAQITKGALDDAALEKTMDIWKVVEEEEEGYGVRSHQFNTVMVQLRKEGMLAGTDLSKYEETAKAPNDTIDSSVEVVDDNAAKMLVDVVVLGAAAGAVAPSGFCDESRTLVLTGGAKTVVCVYGVKVNEMFESKYFDGAETLCKAEPMAVDDEYYRAMKNAKYGHDTADWLRNAAKEQEEREHAAAQKAARKLKSKVQKKLAADAAKQAADYADAAKQAADDKAKADRLAELLRQARAKMADGAAPEGTGDDFHDAAKIYLQALDLSPDSEGVQGEELEAEKQAKFYDLMAKARNQFDPATDSNGDGEAAAEWAACIDTCELALALMPDSKEAHKLKARAVKLLACDKLKRQAAAEAEHGNYNAAASTYGKALALCPKDKEAIDGKAEAERKAMIQKLKQEGEALLAQRKFPEAAAKFGEALKLDKGEDPAIAAEKELAEKRQKALDLLAKAQGEFNDTNYSDCIGTCDVGSVLIRDDPDMADIVKKYDELRAEAERMKEFEKLLGEGEAQMQAQDYAPAVETLEKAVALNPTSREAAQDLADAKRALKIAALKVEGEVLYDGKNYVDAAKKFAEALALDPENAVIEAEGVAAQKKAQAVDWLTKAKAQYGDKDYPDTISSCNVGLGLCPVEDGEPGPEVAALKALAEKKLLAAELERQGDNLVRGKHYDDAIKAYAKCIAVDPGDEEFAAVPKKKTDAERLLLAQQLRKEGEAAYAKKDFDGAVAKFKEALDLTPDNKALAEEEVDAEKRAQAVKLLAQAVAQLNAEDYGECISTCDVGIALGTAETPDLAEVKRKAMRLREVMKLKKQGDALLAKKDFADAVGAYKGAEALCPEDSPKLGEIVASRKEAERLLRSQELKRVGENDMGVNDYEDAVAKFKEALALDPESKELAVDEEWAERKEKAHEYLVKAQGEFAEHNFDACAALCNVGLKLKAGEPEDPEFLKLIAEVERIKAQLAKQHEEELKVQADMAAKKAREIILHTTVETTDTAKWNATFTSPNAKAGRAEMCCEKSTRSGVMGESDATEGDCTSVVQFNTDLEKLKLLLTRKDFEPNCEAAGERFSTKKLHQLLPISAPRAAAEAPEPAAAAEPEKTKTHAVMIDEIGDKVFIDMKVDKDEGRVNFKQFIKWWKKALPKKKSEGVRSKGNKSSISDETLQFCMSAWTEEENNNADGEYGLTTTGLGNVLHKLAAAGMLEHIFSQRAAVVDDSGKEVNEDVSVIKQAAAPPEHALPEHHAEHPAATLVEAAADAAPPQCDVVKVADVPDYAAWSAAFSVDAAARGKYCDDAKTRVYQSKGKDGVSQVTVELFGVNTAAFFGDDALTATESKSDAYRPVDLPHDKAAAALDAAIKAAEESEKAKRGQQLLAKAKALLAAGNDKRLDPEQSHTPAEYDACAQICEVGEALCPDVPDFAALKEQARKIKDADLLRREGEAEIDAKVYPDAIKALEEALVLNPDCPQTKKDLEFAKRKQKVAELQKEAEALADVGKFADAVPKFLEALALDPDNSELSEEEKESETEKKVQDFLEEARKQMAKGKLENCIDDCDGGLAMDPSERSVGIEARRQLEALRKQAQDMLDSDKLRRQAEAEFAAKDFAASAETFGRALALAPTNDEINMEKENAERMRDARILQLQGEAKISEEDGSIVVQGDPDYEAAAKDFMDALALDPLNKDLQQEEVLADHNLRGEKLLSDARNAFAQEDYARTIADATEGVDMWLHTAKEQDAGKWLPELKALKKDAEDALKADNLYKQGVSEIKAGAYTDAVRNLEEAAALEPQREDIAAALAEAKALAEAERLQKEGEAQFADGNFDGAAETLLRALKLNPQNEELSQEEDEAVRQAQIADLLRQAHSEFADERYPDCIGTCELIDKVEPGNKKAAVLKAEAERQQALKDALQKADAELYYGAYPECITDFEAAKALCGPADFTKLKYCDAGVEKARDMIEAASLKKEGEALMAKDSYEAAAVKLQASLAKDPTNSETEAEEKLSQKKAQVFKLLMEARDELAADQCTLCIHTCDVGTEFCSGDPDLKAYIGKFAVMHKQSELQTEFEHLDEKGDVLNEVTDYHHAVDAYKAALALVPPGLDGMVANDSGAASGVGGGELDGLVSNPVFNKMLVAERDATIAKLRETERMATVQDLKRDGEEMLKAGKFSAASADFLRALELDPKNDSLIEDEDKAQANIEANKIEKAWREHSVAKKLAEEEAARLAAKKKAEEDAAAEAALLAAEEAARKLAEEEAAAAEAARLAAEQAAYEEAAREEAAATKVESIFRGHEARRKQRLKLDAEIIMLTTSSVGPEPEKAGEDVPSAQDAWQAFYDGSKDERASYSMEKDTLLAKEDVATANAGERCTACLQSGVELDSLAGVVQSPQYVPACEPYEELGTKKLEELVEITDFSKLQKEHHTIVKVVEISDYAAWKSGFDADTTAREELCDEAKSQCYFKPTHGGGDANKAGTVIVQLLDVDEAAAFNSSCSPFFADNSAALEKRLAALKEGADDNLEADDFDGAIDKLSQGVRLRAGREACTGQWQRDLDAAKEQKRLWLEEQESNKNYDPLTDPAMSKYKDMTCDEIMTQARLKLSTESFATCTKLCYLGIAQPSSKKPTPPVGAPKGIRGYDAELTDMIEEADALAKVQEYMEKAQDNMDEGRWDDAKRFFEMAIEIGDEFIELEEEDECNDGIEECEAKLAELAEAGDANAANSAASEAGKAAEISSVYYRAKILYDFRRGWYVHFAH